MERLQGKALYGAREIKKAIGGNTIKAFIASGSILSLLFALFIIVKPVVSNIDIKLPNNGGTIEIAPPIVTNNADNGVGDEQIPKEETVIDNSTEPTTAVDNPEDFQHLTPTDIDSIPTEDFSTAIIDIDNRNNTDGSIYKDPGLNIGKGNGQGNGKGVGNGNGGNGNNEDIPSKDEFIPVEEYPEFDMKKLQSSIEYPILAKQSGVEGRVIVSVLVHKSGEVIKVEIASSPNTLLNKAAIDAIKNYGIVKPAIQNGQRISAWINIPLNFRLRR